MGTQLEKTVWDRPRLAAPHDQPDKARRVRAMFDGIAPTYELVNRVLSAGRDAHWRRYAVRMAGVQPDDHVLDLACGTGDFARAFARAGPRMIVGSDFAPAMLALAAERDPGDIHWCRADALAMPYGDAAFSIVSCAFGVRNFQSLSQGLSEICRVLAPGGRAVILEFTMPKAPVLAKMYLLYFRHILPFAARLISRDRSGAYDYLPQSVTSFLDARGMVEALMSAGFSSVEHRSLTLGIVTVYVARKV